MENIFFCESCNYKCKYNSEYLKHLNSQKHARQGKKKIYKCETCDYETKISKWNLRMHILSKHSSKEEKLKCKFYCDICDLIFFSPLYFENHKKCINHNNNIKMQNYNATGNIPKIEIVNKINKKEELKNEIKQEIILEIKKYIDELLNKNV